MNDSSETSSGVRSRARGMGSDSRLLQDAGDVDRRWWEAENGSKSAARSTPGRPSGPHQPVCAAFNPPPPPPPLNPEWFRVTPQESGTPEPKSGADGPSAPTAAQAGLDALTVQRLELELAASRDEAAALHEMLEDLPEIFEHKFRQRLQSILEQQQQLLADNQALREQLHALTPGAPAVETRPSRLLLPASQASMPPLPKRNPLGETLRKVLGLGRPAAPETIEPDRFS